MVNDLQELLRDNVASPPPDGFDVGAVVSAGRRRVRRRRTATAGAAALATAGIVGAAAVLHGGGGGREIAGEPPTPDAPVLRLADADHAVDGRDYREIASYTNEDLNADNGQYLDGVTDDGLVLFRDGPRMGQLYPRFALMDPETGKKDWLPLIDGVEQGETRPVELGADRLVLAGMDESRLTDDANGMQAPLVVHVFDRTARRWSELTWPSLPAVEFPSGVVGPDGRLYVRTTATRPGPPDGGWPVGPDGEADDAGADGQTDHLWSVSLTDPDDVRDEGLTLGALAFTDHTMVWTDSANGAAGRVHVRDLSTGAERSFDPHAGKRCNLLSFGATDERIVMGEYCGTYSGGVRDDRVQILTTDGRQVVTLQGSDIDGGLPRGSDVVTITSHRKGDAGAYVYDLAGDRLLRLSDAVSSWALGGPTAGRDQFFWDTPVNGGDGSRQHLGELVR